MLDPYKPPMSLAESERLLKAEADRLKAKDERSFLWSGLGLVFSLVVLLACVGWLALGLFQTLFGR